MKSKFKIKILSLPFLACMVLGLAINTGAHAKPAHAEVKSDRYAIVDPSIYYADLNASTSGATFRKEVYDLMIKTHKYYTTYSELRDAYPYTDGNPNSTNQVELFYTGEYRNFDKTFTGTINREHVWPDSRGVGQEGPGSDSHHLRPCDVKVNGDRGNLGYGIGGYIPTDEYKGVAARIIFYVGAHYGPDSSYNLVINEVINTTASTFGSLKTLLEWNIKYPVNASEQRRNVAAQGIQGNRNPFIDHPEYACRIWGDTSSETRTICDGTTPIKPDAEVDNVISLINNIGPVNLDSLSKIVLAEDAYSALNATQKTKVTNYSTLTTARSIYNQLSSIDPNVANVISLISAIGKVTKNSEPLIIAAETAYSNLAPALQSQVTNYALLTAARLEYNNLMTPVDETSFTLDMYNPAFLTITNQGVNATQDYIKGCVKNTTENYIVGFDNEGTNVRYNMRGGLTLGASGYTGKFTLNIADAMATKLTKIEVYGALYDGTNNNNLTLNGALPHQGVLVPATTSLENVTNPLTWDITTAPYTLTFSSVAGRVTIYQIVFTLAVVDEEVNNIIELIDELGEITLLSGDEIEWIEYLYNELTEHQKAKITNYDVLLAARKALDLIIADSEIASTVVNLIAGLGNITINSGGEIVIAENAYKNLSDTQKTFVFNYSFLQAARLTYDELRAAEVKSLISAIGTVTLDSNDAIRAARTAFNALENFNQTRQVTNFNTLTDAEKVYQDLINGDHQKYTETTSAMAWDGTFYNQGAHTVSSGQRSWLMSSGQLYGGTSYLGTNANNADGYMNFSDANGFEGLESFITNPQNYYSGIKMKNFAVSKPVSITFSWTNNTSAFTVAILASTDHGNTWSRITGEQSVGSYASTATSISWVAPINSASKAKFAPANASDIANSPYVQFAFIAGTGSSQGGTIQNLTIDISTAGRNVDITSARDILVSEIECANTCEDYDLAPQFSASYGNLTSIEKQEFDQIIGMDGVNVKTKLDYMLTLYQQNTPQPAANPLAIISQSDEMLILLALALLSLSGFAVYTFRKKKQYN